MADDNGLERQESYQYPAGHLGRLSANQQHALDNFKKLCEEKGYYTPKKDDNRPSHDDETMLRYLRARKFVPQDAFVQFKDTEDWRKENKIDNLYDTIDIPEYNEESLLYPQWTGRRDKRGIPVYVFEVAGLTSKRMAEYEKKYPSTHAPGGTGLPPKMLRLCAIYENLTRFVLPYCAAMPDRPYIETPVSQSNNIVDISHVGLSQFWNLKDHMQAASQLATAHYPETLDRIFIIGAPSFFPTVWGWIKRWFDPITVSKIFIIGKKEMKSTLETYMDVENIPKKYGGKLDWNWGDRPSLDPAMSGILEWKKPGKDSKGRNGFPIGPVKWRRSPNGDLLAVAVGSEHGQNRHDIVAVLPAHDRELNLAATLSAEAVLGPPSTTGIYTHPTAGQSYFEKTGNTPDETPRESVSEPTLDPRVGHRAEHHPSQVTHAHQLPIRQSGGSTFSRDATSTTRYAQQNNTLAEGHMAAGTPAPLHHGYGDKSHTIETATVGQAPKQVHMPERQPQPSQEPSYLDQAKSMASSAITTATSVLGSAESTVLGAVGLQQNEEQASPAQTEHVSSTPHDPRVDRADNKTLEDFLRSQHSTSK